MKKIVLTFFISWPLLVYPQKPEFTVPPKVEVCIVCHGKNGVSSTPLWPNLAGQHPTYLLKQLKQIQQGTLREVPTMKGILENFNEQDFNDLAVYYAKMPLNQGTTPKKFLKRGEQIYRGGDFEKHITACIACHGPKGTGNAQAGFPVLAGQHAAYTISQLQAFKENKRKNDLNHIMQDISNRMSQDDMEAVANYIQGLY